MDWLTTTPIAHRGLHRGQTIPENSLAAFAAAIGANHPIELDIQALADGQVVVFHDQALYRLTGQPGLIQHQTSETLSRFRLYETDQAIPTLAAALDLIRGQVPVLIEIKNPGQVGPLETALLNLLQSYRGEVAVQSFNPFSLAWFKHQAPSVMRGQLASQGANGSRWWPVQILRSQMLFNWASQPDFIAYQLEALPNLVTSLTRAGLKLPLLAWTIRSDQDRQRAETWADNYIFDAILNP